MCTTASSIHIGCSNCPIAGAYIDPFFNLLVAMHRHRAHSKHSDTQFGVFLDIKTALGSLACFDQEILDDLIIDFNHAQCDFMLDVVLWVVNSLINTAEDLFARPWDDSLVSSIPND